MQALLKLFLLPLALPKNTGAGEDEIEIADQEEGYQASFSKLGASERVKEDPVAYVAEPRSYLAESLVACSISHPGKVRSLPFTFRLQEWELMGVVLRRSSSW